MPLTQSQYPQRSSSYVSGIAQSFMTYLKRIEHNLSKLFMEEAYA